ncbi:MAG: HEAT repeat domain-containing protein [Deltaproteobacteria bacterium]|nr:HEAT repeat domain-containing protein [Deltaproteobacteria bacterium]
MGNMAARLADQDMEEARNVVRRLMWNLNDESGGIGWGFPEAMGEILAQHEGLAGEYTHILVSYTRQDANYLEHQLLQRGLLWAIGRLFRVRPERLREASPHLLHYLGSGDAAVRGLAAERLGEFREPGARHALEGLLTDDAEYDGIMERAGSRRRVMDAAAEALGKIG